LGRQAGRPSRDQSHVRLRCPPTQLTDFQRCDLGRKGSGSPRTGMCNDSGRGFRASIGSTRRCSRKPARGTPAVRRGSGLELAEAAASCAGWQYRAQRRAAWSGLRRRPAHQLQKPDRRSVSSPSSRPPEREKVGPMTSLQCSTSSLPTPRACASTRCQRRRRQTTPGLGCRQGRRDPPTACSPSRRPGGVSTWPRDSGRRGNQRDAQHAGQR
jgi:hypothetical protein